MYSDPSYLQPTIEIIAGILPGLEISGETRLDADLHFSREQMITLLDRLDPRKELFPQGNGFDVLEYGLSAGGSSLLAGADYTVLRLASAWEFAFRRSVGDCDNGSD